jgi:phospholipid transport system substrate-binding protein
MLMQRVMSWVAAVGFVAVSGVALAQQAPDALVRQVSGDVLDAAKADKSIQAGDLTKISALVEAKVLPHVNFTRMTSKTIGPQWNKATPEQKQKVQEEFRTLLLRTYAGALSQVKDQTVDVKPVRDASDDTNVLVRSEIRGKGQPIQLDYRLEKAGDAWKIWDVNVGGLWLVTTYQGQFKPVLSQSGIDGVIKLLVDLNAKAAAARS